jgi:nicotinamidase-related amidase
MEESSVTTEHRLGEQRLHAQYDKAGFQGGVGYGQRPAVLVIDLAEAWTNPKQTLGSDLSEVVRQTCRILDKARERGVPIAFTTMAFEDDLADLPSVLRAKTPHLAELTRNSALVRLHPALQRNPKKEPLLVKPRASAFFATNMLTILVDWKIDTVIVVGCSTSGCIRSTAESATDHGFHTIVPREAVGDRSPTAHQANLFDINARMADVVPVDEVIAYLDHTRVAASA